MDIATHKEKVYFLTCKADAFNAYKRYEAWVEVQCDTRIKIFSTDQGGEFTSDESTQYLEQCGTVCHLMVHDSLQSNGTSERGNHTHLHQTHTTWGCGPSQVQHEQVLLVSTLLT
jgi:hypothetical protein